MIIVCIFVSYKMILSSISYCIVGQLLVMYSLLLERQSVGSLPCSLRLLFHPILKIVEVVSGARGRSFGRQLNNHKITVSRIESVLGDNKSAANLLSKCIYTVGMGNNDYINNYFSQFYPKRSIYTPEQFATVLIQQYSHQLKTLYNYGARKIAVFGLGLIGCTPGMIAMYGTNGSSCVDFINNAVQ
ncbi:hypothetical protein ACOSQ2_004272 [Xanthoceras sorbifolium]